MQQLKAPIIFLDIDGVLNDRRLNKKAESSTIKQRCVYNLNLIIEKTNCDIVIASSWRYMILGGAMTISGFEYLLRTHGLYCSGRIKGFLGEDKSIATIERGRLVREYLIANHITNYIVIDDMNLGFKGLRFYQTKGNKVLTKTDANRIINILRTSD